MRSLIRLSFLTCFLLGGYQMSTGTIRPILYAACVINGDGTVQSPVDGSLDRTTPVTHVTNSGTYDLNLNQPLADSDSLVVATYKGGTTNNAIHYLRPSSTVVRITTGAAAD